MKIGHFADIHIKGLSRHDEFRLVLSEAIDRMIETQVKHVMIVGDIFHTKTQGLTSEYFSFMTWWFNAMAEHFEVHMVLGNHDFNQLNLSRMDAISPIVEAINNPRVHLYKESGVYPIEPGYNWCIFSIYDQDNWNKVVPVPGDVNIACFHGPVYGAVTETDWDIETDMQVDFFREKGFDFVFLGDIHRTQFLDHRSIELEVDEEELKNFPNAYVIEEIV